MLKQKIRCLELNSGIIVICVILLFASNIHIIPFRRFYDDFIALLLGIILVISMIKNQRIPKKIFRFFFPIILITIIGIASNMVFDLDRSKADIMGDLFAFWKIFLVYAGVNVLLNKKGNRAVRVNRFLGTFSRLFITVAFIFGILNIIGIVNMSTTARYGIKNYAFCFMNPSQFGVFAGAAMAFILFDNNKKIIYELMAIAVLFMTAKGMALIIALTYITLNLISKRKQLKLWQITLVGVVLIFALQFQIQGYLLDETAPRAILIRYGFKTANDFFPLGSGFATYGSNQAAVHYSPLYVKYGFLNRRALSGFLENGTTFLNDVYLGMIVGQFGFFGLGLFMLVIFEMFKDIFEIKVTDHRKKYIVIACFICMCGMFVMAGSVKAQPGEILMIVIALYSFSSDSRISEGNKAKTKNSSVNERGC